LHLRNEILSLESQKSFLFSHIIAPGPPNYKSMIQELRFLHIDRLFNYVVTRDVTAKHFGLSSLPFFPFHEQRRKLYECALAMARCNPNSAVVIGDMGRELKPAKELGIATVGLVTYKARKNELRNASDFLISSITQLQNVLLELDKTQLTR